LTLVALCHHLRAMPRKREEEREIPITIRFPPEVHTQATALADEDDRSFNSYVVRAVRAQIERDREFERERDAKRKAAR